MSKRKSSSCKAFLGLDESTLTISERAMISMPNGENEKLPPSGSKLPKQLKDVRNT